MRRKKQAKKQRKRQRVAWSHDRVDTRTVPQLGREIFAIFLGQNCCATPANIIESSTILTSCRGVHCLQITNCHSSSKRSWWSWLKHFGVLTLRRPTSLQWRRHRAQLVKSCPFGRVRTGSWKFHTVVGIYSDGTGGFAWSNLGFKDQRPLSVGGLRTWLVAVSSWWRLSEP